MSEQRSEEVMRRYLTEVVAQGKLELIDELAAEDMVDKWQAKRACHPPQHESGACARHRFRG
ncbi:MAG: hypothetical protein OXP36_13470 [Gammaproteobacteria bacterium]|nr:hypothetical protein [Gammaproteobacteria bacterium]